MLGFASEADYVCARDILTEANYTESGLAAKLGRARILSVGAVDLPPWLRCTRDLSPQDTFIRLFLLGRSVPMQAVRAALAPMSLDSWISAGLLAAVNNPDELVPQVKLLPLDDLILASDSPKRWTQDVRPDFVMAPGITTVELAHATIRETVNRTLDLGTGCGVLGLLSASHSDEVVATDSNPRSVGFAHFNGRLNGLANVNCRLGSLFDPIAAEERFDLVVSNPPFVISPSKRFQFRDAGKRGDEFCQGLIRAVPSYLNPGGYCQLKCNFAHRAGEDWRQDLTCWFEELPCDVIVWVERVEDASEYAMTWIVGTESHDLDKVPDIYDRWMDYFVEQRIEAVSYLLITMRRTDQTRNWIRIDSAHRHIVSPCGSELLNTFALQDHLGGVANDASLLDSCPRLAGDVHVEQQHAMSSEGLQAVETHMRKAGGSQFAMRVESHVAGLVVRLDGTRSVRTVLAEMAHVLGGDVDTVQDKGLVVIRSLLDQGILNLGKTWSPAQVRPT